VFYKFSVRIVHFGEGRYMVQYRKFWPWWYTLERFIELGSMAIYNPVLLHVEEAEKFAQNFKTFEDVNRWQLCEVARRMNWLEDRRRIRAMLVPYLEKRIL